MNAKHRDRIAGALLFVFAVAWCVAVRVTVPPGFSNESVGPRAMPFWLGVALAALAVCLIAGTCVNESESGGFIKSVPHEAKRSKQANEIWAICLVGAAVVAYGLLMGWFGFVPATIIVIAAVLYFGLRVRSIPLILGMSCGFGFGVYIVMDRLMGVALPHGTVISII